ncbi:uncharacterized protein N0V96_002595 [Colletotrichum fioriniae]|uniref:uncharacterized protein n=1 Tax=Colletotrichum fioriniae TaxID=710243 RepID=UPI0032DB2130|nr:hypothetical protein N0V96_002595 [Colletotrichum fioriniae]
MFEQKADSGDESVGTLKELECSLQSSAVLLTSAVIYIDTVIEKVIGNVLVSKSTGRLKGAPIFSASSIHISAMVK